MRTSFILSLLLPLLLIAVIASGEAASTDSVAAPTEKAAAPAENCFLPIVKRCCADAGATLSVPCSLDGVQWTCRTAPSQNDLFMTTKSSSSGWVFSVETGNLASCVYKKVSCGTQAGTCKFEGNNTVLTCKEKDVRGNLCESPAE